MLLSIVAVATIATASPCKIDYDCVRLSYYRSIIFYAVGRATEQVKAGEFAGYYYVTGIWPYNNLLVYYTNSRLVV